ncbi:MAG TPA: patatin-like phospholipase family protein, partial [Polyangia bacterium]|nr:patatin-like phospholipase family protein [Polyangia bacterium]
MTTLAERLDGRRVGLALASGFFGFFHHAGVLRALHERGVRPVHITGNSAGALVAAMYAAGREPRDICEELLTVRRRDFWDPHFPFSPDGFGLLAGHRFAARLSAVLPVHSCERCRIPVAVGAFDIDEGRVRHLGSGPLIPALLASCAVPYLFQPVRIDGRRLVDGGLGEKTPLVPFLGPGDVDVVVVSYLPPRRGTRLPLAGPLADTPAEERLLRDVCSAELLAGAGIEVVVLTPERVALGPFSLERAPAA